MAKFKNKNTGVILTTENEFVIKQLSKNPDYAPYKKGAGTPKNAENKSAQSDVTAEIESSTLENEEQ